MQADGRRGGVRAGLWASRRRDPRPIASVPRGAKDARTPTPSPEGAEHAPLVPRVHLLVPAFSDDLCFSCESPDQPEVAREDRPLCLPCAGAGIAFADIGNVLGVALEDRVTPRVRDRVSDLRVIKRRRCAFDRLVSAIRIERRDDRDMPRRANASYLASSSHCA